MWILSTLCFSFGFTCLQFETALLFFDPPCRDTLPIGEMSVEPVIEPVLRAYRTATVARTLEVPEATVQLSFAEQDAAPEVLLELHGKCAHLATTRGDGACALHAALL